MHRAKASTIRDMSDTAPIEHPIWLTTGDFTEADEPLRLFAAWYEEARRRPRVQRHDACDRRCAWLPNARMVLLKGFDERGFVFYTNTDSHKAQELEQNPRRRWSSTGSRSPPGPPARAVRGVSRPRPTPISPHARGWRRSAPGQASSPRRWKAAWPLRRQSPSMPRFTAGSVPRPPNWSGYRAERDRILAGPALSPARPRRIHEPPHAPWTKTRLYP